MISGGQAAVARATAAVFVDGRRAGSAVLVAPRCLVTAAHVLQRQDPGTLVKVAVEQVELEFPAQGPGGQTGRAATARVDLGAAGAGVDVAVLDLGADRPGWLPAPVPVWPAARPPGRVQVFGYPLAEGPLNGVWRQFTVAGPAAAGAVQLDWLGDAGTFPGHSGGPVIDAAGHALAGILVEGAERGRFDRFVPVTLIARVWPGLPRPWLMAGAEPGEARGHFTRRARGQRSIARGGDLFRGRHAALDRFREWLTADQAPGQPLVLTGQPGAGKSAVLARAALSVEAGQGGPGLAFHARAATIGGFLTAMADLTGIGTPASADELVTSLADLPGQPPIAVVLDALDEAASDRDRRQITETLAELAVLPGLRVAVATRTLAVGNPLAPGGLLPALGVATRDDHNLIDLDSDAYFDLDGLRQFAAALLAQDGMDHPGPPGAAWTQYRARHSVRDQLAAVIAERAGRNFLAAAMAAVPLSTARAMTDPAANGFDPAGIPSGVGEALSKYLDRLPDQRQERDRQLLTALAYARGAGLDDPAWLAFAAALGYSASVPDLDALRRSPAADYLLQSTTTEHGARPVTRLFHQALTDELLAPRHRPSDESMLLDLLLGQAERTGWQDRYLREHAAEHAAAAGRLDQLLEDPHYLLTVDPAWLVPHLDNARSAPARATATVYRQSAHHIALLDRPARASQLELTAHQLGWRSLAARIAGAAPDRPWQTRWSHTRQATGHQVLTGHTGGVAAVAVGALADGTPVIISGGRDGTIRVWRLADGTPVGQPLTGHANEAAAVAVGALADGTPVIVSGGQDATIRAWRLADGSPLWPPLTGHAGAVYAVAVGVLPGGAPVIVSGGQDATIRAWRLADGSPLWPPLTGVGIEVQLAIGKLADRTPVIVSANGALWRLSDGFPLRSRAEDVGWNVVVTVGALPDGTSVAVSSGIDAPLTVWRLDDGSVIGRWRTEPAADPGWSIGGSAAVAVGTLADGTPVIISDHDNRNVHITRLADGAPISPTLIGHGHGYAISSVATSALPDGTPVIVSGGNDGTVRVWRLLREPAFRQSGRRQRPAGDYTAWTVAVGALADGTLVAVSGGSNDNTVRVWRLADGEPHLPPLRGHTSRVRAVAAGTLPDGSPVAVSGSYDGTIRVWRLEDGRPVGKPHALGGWITAVAVGALPDGTPVIVSGGDGENPAMIWVSQLTDGRMLGSWRTGDEYVPAVAVGALPDGTPVIVSGGGNGPRGDGLRQIRRERTPAPVRVWRLADGAPIGGPLNGHVGPVYSVAIGALPDGTPVIVSGGTDWKVRVWRLTDGIALGPPLVGHNGDVCAVAAGTLPDGTHVALSGGDDRTVRAWQLADHAPLWPTLRLPGSVVGVAMKGAWLVVANGTAGISVHQPRLLESGAPN